MQIQYTGNTFHSVTILIKCEGVQKGREAAIMVTFGKQFNGGPQFRQIGGAIRENDAVWGG